jgi:poly(3-hydroxybutyrate) depolymerase
MIRPVFTTVFLLFFSTTVSAQTKVTMSFKIGSTTNSCNFYVPSNATKPPVVFFIHGANGSGGGFENETKGDVVAEKEKFIAVYPSASGNGGAGVWNDMSGTSNFPLFKAILDTLDKRYSIDRNKIYMTGFSQGGFISFVAGCSFSDIFAAVAPVSGHAGSSCNIKRPVPVHLIFGAQEDKAAFVKDLQIWLKLDTCPATPTVTRPFNGVTRVTYGPCAQGTYVIMDSVSGQGHMWPNKMNTAEEVWTFFKQFSLKGTTATAGPQSAASVRIPISASYSSGIVRLQGTADKALVSVTDTKGRQVFSEELARQQFSFQNHPGGVYVIRVHDAGRTSAVSVVIP